MTGELTRQASGYASVREFSSWAKGPLNQMSTLGVGVADGATAAAQEFSATIRRISGSSTLAGAEDDRVVYAAGAAAIAIAFIVVRGVGEAGAGAEMGAGSVDAVGKDATDEGQLLQPIGVTIQDTVVVPEGGERQLPVLCVTCRGFTIIHVLKGGEVFQHLGGFRRRLFLSRCVLVRSFVHSRSCRHPSFPKLFAESATLFLCVSFEEE